MSTTRRSGGSPVFLRSRLRCNVVLKSAAQIVEEAISAWYDLRRPRVDREDREKRKLGSHNRKQCRIAMAFGIEVPCDFDTRQYVNLRFQLVKRIPNPAFVDKLPPSFETIYHLSFLTPEVLEGLLAQTILTSQTDFRTIKALCRHVRSDKPIVEFGRKPPARDRRWWNRFIRSA